MVLNKIDIVICLVMIFSNYMRIELFLTDHFPINNISSGNFCFSIFKLCIFTSKESPA